MRWTEDEVSKTISNPIYCLRWRGAEPIISEDFWIKAATVRIERDQDGGVKFLRELIEHLNREAPLID
jgi:hypothetical protein